VAGRGIGGLWPPYLRKERDAKHRYGWGAFFEAAPPTPAHIAFATFADPPRRFAGGREMKIRSRDANASEVCCTARSKTSRQIKQGGGAPRDASIQWPHHISGRYRPNMRGARQRASQTSLRSLRTLSATAPARLPALHRGTRRTRRIQYRLSSRPALPETRLGGRYPAFACHSLPSTSGTGRSAGRSGTQSRPGAVCETARGHRTHSTFRIASGMCPATSELSPL
jgi:hypothetical protein